MSVWTENWRCYNLRTLEISPHVLYYKGTYRSAKYGRENKLSRAHGRVNMFTNISKIVEILQVYYDATNIHI